MEPRIPRFRQEWPRLLPDAQPEIWDNLERAFRLLEDVEERLRNGYASDADQPMRVRGRVLTPVRCLILAHVGRASGLGVTPARLARALGIPRGTLAHHIDVLEHGGFETRRPAAIHDGRRMAVRLTHEGAAALSRAAAELRTVETGAHSARPLRDRWNQRLLSTAAARS